MTRRQSDLIGVDWQWPTANGVPSMETLAAAGACEAARQAQAVEGEESPRGSVVIAAWLWCWLRYGGHAWTPTAPRFYKAMRFDRDICERCLCTREVKTTWGQR